MMTSAKNLLSDAVDGIRDGHTVRGVMCCWQHNSSQAQSITWLLIIIICRFSTTLLEG
ncbi:hypothetical protein HMPREF9153_1254 [Cutibacterium avidum ATCC 25577]|uniref:Uncharacterized protein n=1 Tax=Cutibacterium avidum ATCC 25577 TaxID=997355 RepID=G4CXJ7_9ACTN|nr:hypothetical protein HMPREF9153_1254 [Cutibacterium avidum ATCC 25577]